MENLTTYLFTTLPIFLGYFLAAIVMATVFLGLYVNVTPHSEFALIRSGNTSAATQLVGSFLGFAIPMAMVTGHSVSVIDMVLWGIVVLIVQIAVFFVIARILFRNIEARIADNCTASGIFVGGISLGIGILQAACMVP